MAASGDLCRSCRSPSYFIEITPAQLACSCVPLHITDDTVLFLRARPYFVDEKIGERRIYSLVIAGVAPACSYSGSLGDQKASLIRPGVECDRAWVSGHLISANWPRSPEKWRSYSRSKKCSGSGSVSFPES